MSLSFFSKLRRTWRRLFSPCPRLQAHIDFADNGKIVSGWVLDRCNPDHKIEITLEVDGMAVATVRADGYRPDLAQAFESDGCHAFSATIDSENLALKEGKIEVYDSESGRRISTKAKYLEYDLKLWNRWREKDAKEFENALGSSLFPLYRDGRLKELSIALEEKRETSRLTDLQALMLLRLYLTLGEFTSVRELYRWLGRKEQKDSVVFRRSVSTIWEYCSHLWQKRCNEVTVLLVRKLELFLLVWPDCLSLTAEEPTEDEELIFLLSHLILSGFFLSRKDVERIAALFPRQSSKSNEDAIQEYAELLEPLRTLHRAILTVDASLREKIIERFAAKIERGTIFAEEICILIRQYLETLFLQKALSPEELAEFLSAVSIFSDGDGETSRQWMKDLSSRREAKSSNEMQSPASGKVEWTRMPDPLYRPRRDELICILVQRDEYQRLEGFLEYYRKMGVERFYIVDNASEDSRILPYLRAQEDVELFETQESYASSRFGIDWVEEILRLLDHRGWVLVLDADEILAIPERFDGIPGLCSTLVRSSYEALGVPLLDMYSDKPIRQTRYRPGEEMLLEAPWYDARFFTTFSPKGGAQGRDLLYQGGVRSRVFGIDSVVLNKVPLFRYRPGVRLWEGMHWIDGGRKAYGMGVLLHFKYLQSFHDYAAREAARGEHWNGASEYRLYDAYLRENPDFSLYDPIFSNRWKGVEAFFERYPAVWSSDEK